MVDGASLIDPTVGALGNYVGPISVAPSAEMVMIAQWSMALCLSPHGRWRFAYRPYGWGVGKLFKADKRSVIGRDAKQP